MGAWLTIENEQNRLPGTSTYRVSSRLQVLTHCRWLQMETSQATISWKVWIIDQSARPGPRGSPTGHRLRPAASTDHPTLPTPTDPPTDHGESASRHHATRQPAPRATAAPRSAPWENCWAKLRSTPARVESLVLIRSSVRSIALHATGMLPMDPPGSHPCAVSRQSYNSSRRVASWDSSFSGPSTFT